MQDVPEVLKYLKEKKIETRVVRTRHEDGTRIRFEIPITKEEKRTVNMYIYSYFILETYSFSKESIVDFVNQVNSLLSKDEIGRLANTGLIVFETIGFQIDENGERTYSDLTTLRDVTNNCGMLQLTNIPRLRRVEEWKVFNSIIERAFPRKGLIIASHNRGAIEGDLRTMVESGWEVGKYAYNPNAETNIAILSLYINQP